MLSAKQGAQLGKQGFGKSDHEDGVSEELSSKSLKSSAARLMPKLKIVLKTSRNCGEYGTTAYLIGALVQKRWKAGN
jgi:hypothetical protein